MDDAGDSEEKMGSPVGLGGRGAVLKFAVLHHVGHGVSHFDFLLEVPGEALLMTWRVAIGPERWAGATAEEMGAERIAGHRLMYMTYEGPVSGGRGEVKRVAIGEALVLRETRSLLKLKLEGKGADCELELPM